MTCSIPGEIGAQMAVSRDAGNARRVVDRMPVGSFLISVIIVRWHLGQSRGMRPPFRPGAPLLGRRALEPARSSRHDVSAENERHRSRSPSRGNFWRLSRRLAAPPSLPATERDDSSGGAPGPKLPCREATTDRTYRRRPASASGGVHSARHAVPGLARALGG